MWDDGVGQLPWVARHGTVPRNLVGSTPPSSATTSRGAACLRFVCWRLGRRAHPITGPPHREAHSDAPNRSLGVLSSCGSAVTAAPKGRRNPSGGVPPGGVSEGGSSTSTRRRRRRSAEAYPTQASQACRHRPSQINRPERVAGPSNRGRVYSQTVDPRSLKHALRRPLGRWAGRKGQTAGISAAGMMMRGSICAASDTSS